MGTKRRGALQTGALLAAAAIPLAFLAVFFVLPVVGMTLRGFRPDGTWDFGIVPDVLGRSRIQRVVWFTIWIAALATALSVALGLPVAHALYRTRLPVRGVWRALIVMPFVLPTVVVGVAFRTLLVSSGPLGFLGLDGTWVAIVLAMVFFNLGVVVRTVGAAWEGIDPRPAEAAAALGASPAQVFRTITWPALRPAVLSATSVVFLFCAGAFGVVLTLGGLRYSTIETEIYLQTVDLFDLRAAAVLSLLQFVVVIGLLAVTEILRMRRKTVRRTARRATLVRPGWSAGVTALVIVFILTPIAALVIRSLHSGDSWSLDNYRRLGTVGDGTALQVTALHALSTSWRIAVDATLMALTLGLIVAFVVSRRPASRVARGVLGVLDGVFMLPLGISAVTVGFGFLITLDRPPLDLRTSPWLVPIAQALVALPLVVRTVLPALRSVDSRQREAARALGASAARAFVTVDLPVVIRPVLAAAGFALAVSFGEFGATSFLARPQNPTLPVVIYQLIGRPGEVNFGMAIAASVILAAVTATIMGLVERLRVPTGAF